MQFEEACRQPTPASQRVVSYGIRDPGGRSVQRLIEQEKAKLATVRLSIESGEREVSALASQVSQLRGQVLVVEETLLLESFALYEPKFKLNASHEYKTRLDGVRDRQKAMVKNGEGGHR
ncbi:hypothetical protein [Piscinibacter sp.]|uniref:hypothetical protein n=1 Tax=Piscinibacter sp. TaxID=1903157 RepID=UPI0025D4E47E|nr:hypothetical protein [Piscinibacter sp.]